mgnify:FL=1
MRKREEKRYSKTKQIAVSLLLVTTMSLMGCGQRTSSGTATEAQTEATPAATAQAERVDTGFVVTNPDSYDSADTAVLVDINNVDSTVTLLNLDLNRRYTLSMDGTTRFADKYGNAISLNQLQEGDIVDVTFLKSQKHLTSMQLAQTAWQYDDVERYEMNNVRNEVTIGGEVFQLSKDTQYFSQGHNIEKMDLNPADILTFHGIDSTVLSVTVEKGHGYLRLVNDENFVGGWLEIGQTQIVQITEDMLVTVPEGSYQVDISYNGSGGTKNVVINRNEETTLDIGDLEVAEAQYGMVLFSMSPSNAELYIDGSQADPSQPISLEYGIHQIIAKSDGYKSLTQYLRVGQESAGVDVQLDKVDSDSEEGTSGSSSGSASSSSTGSTSSTESTSTVDTTTTYYRVHIDAPENAEVYLDGSYVGISPCSFRKTSGSHVITLRKSGYETRSYTVQVDDEQKDVSYSFVDLIPGSPATE